jgi:hypothetical protein
MLAHFAVCVVPSSSDDHDAGCRKEEAQQEGHQCEIIVVGLTVKLLTTTLFDQESDKEKKKSKKGSSGDSHLSELYRDAPSTP